MKGTLAAKPDDMAKQLYSFRFDAELIKEVDKLAKKDYRTLTNFLELLMNKALEEAKAKKK